MDLRRTLRSRFARRSTRPLGRLSLGGSALILAVALAACSSGSSPAPTTAPAASPASSAAAASAAPPASASANAVTIQNFAFNPASLTVAVGTTVTWTNADAAGHTVTADDGSFDSKTVASGTTFSQAFTKAGTYTYHCSIHTSMKATIVVQ